MTTLAIRLRSAREAAGFGIRELARRSGRPESYGDISRIEAGKQIQPSAEKLAAYAEALGVSLEWLISGGSSPPPSLIAALVTAHPGRWSEATIAAAYQLEAACRSPAAWLARMEAIERAIRETG